MKVLLVVSGPVGVGKSAVLDAFRRRFTGERISTRGFIVKRKQIPEERGALQRAGEQLDRDTDGMWVAQDLRPYAQKASPETIILLDAARIERQVYHLRQQYGDKVFHLHLTASDGILAERYANRDPQIKEFSTYAELRNSPTEAAVNELARVADFVVDAGRTTPESVAARVATRLGYLPNATQPCVDVIVGAQFGSEGKGNICAHLARGYDLLIRVGGPNAGHRVSDPAFDYVQIPSGTGSNPAAKIMIGAGATIWPATLDKEIKHWGLTPDRLYIDGQAMIIEPSDQAMEEKTFDALGSTKKGVGVATARKIMCRDEEMHLNAKCRLARDIEAFKPFLRDTKLELEKAYANQMRIMLEGTQGTDLSIHHGQYPKVTSRETTASGCLADAGIAPNRVRKVIAVTRTYPIRVGGKSGDLPNEISLEVIAQRSGIPIEELRKTEVGTISGKARRIGEFNWEQVRRAVILNGATDIALTFADYLAVENQNATSFDELTSSTRDFICELERMTGVKVSLISKAFRADGVISGKAG